MITENDECTAIKTRMYVIAKNILLIVPFSNACI